MTFYLQPVIVGLDPTICSVCTIAAAGRTVSATRDYVFTGTLFLYHGENDSGNNQN